MTTEAQPPRPWTIYATDRRNLRAEIRVVNRRRDRVISRIETTRIRFEDENAAAEYLARLPINPRWAFSVGTL